MKSSLLLVKPYPMLVSIHSPRLAQCLKLVLMFTTLRGANASWFGCKTRHWDIARKQPSPHVLLTTASETMLALTKCKTVWNASIARTSLIFYLHNKNWNKIEPPKFTTFIALLDYSKCTYHFKAKEIQKLYHFQIFETIHKIKLGQWTILISLFNKLYSYFLAPDVHSH